MLGSVQLVGKIGKSQDIGGGMGVGGGGCWSPNSGADPGGCPGGPDSFPVLFP